MILNASLVLVNPSTIPTFPLSPYGHSLKPFFIPSIPNTHFHITLGTVTFKEI